MDVFFSPCPIRIPLPEGAASPVFHPFAYSEEINQEEVSHIITTEHYKKFKFNAITFPQLELREQRIILRRERRRMKEKLSVDIVS